MPHFAPLNSDFLPFGQFNHDQFPLGTFAGTDEAGDECWLPQPGPSLISGPNDCTTASSLFAPEHGPQLDNEVSFEDPLHFPSAIPETTLSEQGWGEDSAAFRYDMTVS